MKRFTFLAVLAAFVLGSVLPLAAAEVTLTGTLVCAKCGLKKADVTECQDVLLVGSESAPTEYWVTKNKVAEESGEACTLKIPATITGEVIEKDGRKWITPSKIVKKQ